MANGDWISISVNSSGMQIAIMKRQFLLQLSSEYFGHLEKSRRIQQWKNLSDNFNIFARDWLWQQLPHLLCLYHSFCAEVENDAQHDIYSNLMRFCVLITLWILLWTNFKRADFRHTLIIEYTVISTNHSWFSRWAREKKKTMKHVWVMEVIVGS